MGKLRRGRFSRFRRATFAAVHADLNLEAAFGRRVRRYRPAARIALPIASVLVITVLGVKCD